MFRRTDEQVKGQIMYNEHNCTDFKRVSEAI